MDFKLDSCAKKTLILTKQISKLAQIMNCHPYDTKKTIKSIAVILTSLPLSAMVLTLPQSLPIKTLDFIDRKSGTAYVNAIYEF